MKRCDSKRADVAIVTIQRVHNTFRQYRHCIIHYVLDNWCVYTSPKIVSLGASLHIENARYNVVLAIVHYSKWIQDVHVDTLTREINTASSYTYCCNISVANFCNNVNVFFLALFLGSDVIFFFSLQQNEAQHPAIKCANIGRKSHQFLLLTASTGAFVAMVSTPMLSRIASLLERCF